jgi:hypothetical protein
MTEDRPEATEVVAALEKHPELLIEVSMLLSARSRHPRRRPRPVSYTAELTEPLTLVPGIHDMQTVHTLILPDDAPMGDYTVKATFDTDAHLTLHIDDIDTHASGNSCYMKTEAVRLGEPFRITLRASIIPLPGNRTVRKAKITATHVPS